MEKVSAMLKGGGGDTTSFGIVLTWELGVLAMLKGVGRENFHSLRVRKVLPCLEGLGQKARMRDFPIL